MACQIESPPTLLRHNYQEDTPGASALNNNVMNQVSIKTPVQRLAVVCPVLVATMGKL